MRVVEIPPKRGLMTLYNGVTLESLTKALKKIYATYERRCKRCGRFKSKDITINYCKQCTPKITMLPYYV